MAITGEVLRGDRKQEKKKEGRWDSMEGHLKTLAIRKAQKASLTSEVAAFDAIIAGIVSQAKQDELNASAVVVRIRAIYAQDIARENAGVVGQRGSISALNDLVQADGEYNATEKQEFTDAKANEV
jgi:hypothetical protein